MRLFNIEKKNLALLLFPLPSFLFLLSLCVRRCPGHSRQYCMDNPFREWINMHTRDRNERKKTPIREQSRRL